MKSTHAATATNERRKQERRIKDIGERGIEPGIGSRSGIDRRGEGIYPQRSGYLEAAGIQPTDESTSDFEIKDNVARRAKRNDVGPAKES
jgi:hypothetical protein